MAAAADGDRRGSEGWARGSLADVLRHRTSEKWAHRPVRRVVQRAVMLGVAISIAGSLVASSASSALWPDAPDRVRAELTSADVARRRAAALALDGVARDQVVALLKIAVADADDGVRLAAASTASRRGVVEVADAIVSWLTDTESDTKLRAAACAYLTAVPDAKSVKLLARALGDGDVDVRLAAVKALGASSSTDAIAPLLARLDDGSTKVRVAVAQALGKLGDRRAVTPLVAKVQDEASEVRQAVVRALGELGDAKASPALIVALRDAATEVRVDALEALGRLRAADAVASIAPLIAADPRRPASAEVRRAALAALGRIGTPGAVDAIVRAFGLGDDAPTGLTRAVLGPTPAREAAVSAGTASVGAMLAILRGESAASASPTLDAQIASSAAWVLGELKPAGASDAIVRALRRGALQPVVAMTVLATIGDDAQLPVCLEHVASSDPVVRQAALSAVASLLRPETPDGRAVEPLLQSLDVAATPADRAQIATLLGLTGAARVAPVLAGLTAAHDETLRISAIDALSALGTAAEASAAGVLSGLLADASGAVRFRAALALGHVGGAAALGKTLDRLASATEIDRLAAVIALGGLFERAGDDATVTRARAIVDAGLGAERDLLVVAIGRAPGKAASEVLKKWLASPDADLRRAAAVGLGARMGDDARAATLRSALADADSSVRAQIVWSLGAVGAASDASLLAPLLADPSLAVAADAAFAVGRLASSGTVEIGDTLCKALGDDRALVRADAAAALARLVRSGRRAGLCADAKLDERLVVGDASDTVRAAASGWIGARLTSTTLAAPIDEARRLRDLLDHCAAADPSGQVAERCRQARAVEPARASRTDALVVFVAATDASDPVARAAYAIERPDGAIHVGVTDRRGSVTELFLPRGELQLRPIGAGSTATTH